jgi:hypothetical protein
MNTKICSKCKIEKSAKDFYKRGDRINKIRSQCKQCTDLSNNNYKINNLEKYRQAQQKWCNNNKQHRQEVSKKYRELNA